MPAPGLAQCDECFVHVQLRVRAHTGPAGTFQVDAGGYTGTLNATGNWWGAITGPTTTANPGGTGQTIADPAPGRRFPAVAGVRSGR